MTSNDYQIICIRSLEALQSLKEEIQRALGKDKYERFLRIIEKTVILIAIESKTRCLSATCYAIKKKGGNREEINIYEIGETWTSPEHRRKGLFSLLVISTIKQIDSENKKWIVYGTPNSQSTPGYQKLNFTIKDTDIAAYYFPRIISFLKSKKNLVTREKTKQGEVVNNIKKKYKTWITNSDEDLSGRLLQNGYEVETMIDKKMVPRGIIISRGDKLGGNVVRKVSSVMYQGQNDLSIYELVLLARKEKKLTRQLGYDGLYFFEKDGSILKKIVILLLGGIFHRRIQICYKTNIEHVEFKNFNIIDCDIA